MSFVLNRLDFAYPARAGKDAARGLVGVSAELAAGQIVALLGPSGSGKSTLLNLLGLLRDEPSPAGAILYRGQYDYAILDSRDRDRLRRREFGFVLQSCPMLPHFSCLDNVALPLRLRGASMEEARRRAAALIARTGDAKLVEASARRSDGVSQGQKQRFAVLRAIVHEPRVVFADEPTSSLDPGNTRRMIGMLADWQRAGTADDRRLLVLVCHHLETARQVADRVVLLNGDNRLELAFPRADWPLHDVRVREILDGAGIGETGSPPASPPPEIRETPPMEKPAMPPDSDPGFGFLAGFARHDLFDARARWTRRVIVATVALLTALGLVALAWPGLAERGRREKMVGDNAANLMWVWSARNFVGISPATVNRLDDRLQDRLGSEFLGVYPFYEAQIQPAYWNADPAAPPVYPPAPARGRTVASRTDPLLLGLKERGRLLSGRTFESDGEPGLIVTPRFLRDLEVPPGAEPPSHVRLEGRSTPVPILGVTRANLPQGDRFLILESFDDRLKLGEFDDEPLPAIASGKVGTEWENAFFADPARRAEVTAFLREKKSVRSTFNDAAHRFELTSLTGNPPAVRKWKEILTDFGAETRRLGLPAEPNLAKSANLVPPAERNPPEDRPPPQRNPEYHRLAVHLRDLPAQEFALPAIDELGLQTSETIVEQLRASGEAAAEARRMLAWILIFVLALVALNLAVIQTLRLQQKAPEIGLLRALGMRKIQLDTVFVVQAALLWLVGVAYGTALAAAILVCLLYGTPFSEVLDGTWRTMALAFTGAVLAVLLLTAGLASRLVGWGSPADRLSGGQ